MWRRVSRPSRISISSSTTSTRPLSVEADGSGADISGGIYRLFGGGQAGGLSACPGPRQPKLEPGTPPAAGDLDGTLVLLDDPVGHSQAHAGAFAHPFSGEARIVAALDMLGRDTVAGVGNIHARAGFLGPSSHREHAPAIHGIARVEEQIQENLLQLARVAVHGRQAAGEIQLHFHAHLLNLMFE